LKINFFIEISPVSLVILDTQSQHKRKKKSTLTLFLSKLQEWKGHYGKAGVSSFAAGLGLRKQQCMNIIRENMERNESVRGNMHSGFNLQKLIALVFPIDLSSIFKLTAMEISVSHTK